LNILVPNLGSTSLKYRILEMPSERALAAGKIERVTDYRAAISSIAAGNTKIDAVAFKAVHGGDRYRGTFRIDDEVVSALREYLPAAPAHNAIYLTAIDAFTKTMPGIPLIAAFETEFHATMPDYAKRYGIPAEWGVTRLGFHGASHQYVAQRVPELIGRSAEGLRLVSCHLGGSSSICAIRNGRSIDTTMGFSPQSGLENATRHGDFDVFGLLYLMQRRGWMPAEAGRQLASTGGLAGISGIAGGDVRDLEEASRGGNHDAQLALDVFAYEVKKTLGAYAAALGGLDAVAFTGGIGENSALLRARCCDGLEFLGLLLDPNRNEHGAGDRVVSADRATAKIAVLTTNEELIVARRAYGLLAAAP
jgi:acetate kinase